MIFFTYNSINYQLKKFKSNCFYYGRLQICSCKYGHLQVIHLNTSYVKVQLKSGEKWVISKDAVKNMKDEFPMKVIEKFKGKKLVGKEVEILYAEQPVYVSHDISAKTDYGTGVVYYCSYGGLDCVQWLGRHPEAKAVRVMDETGTYTKGPA